MISLEKLERFKTKNELIQVHDWLMANYGWIPLEEFKKLPIPTVMNLLEAIDDRIKKQNKQIKRLKNGK